MLEHNEEEILRDPPPFTRRVEFQGSLTKGEKTVDGLHILLFVPETRTRSISGWVFGDSSTAERLEALMRRPGPLLEMRSLEHEDQQEVVFSDEVMLRKVARRGWPKAYGKMQEVVAKLELHGVRIRHVLSDSDRDHRRLVYFLLAGPGTIWPLFLMRTRHDTGEAKVDGKWRTLSLVLPSWPEMEVELSRQFRYSEMTLPDGRRVQAEDAPYCLTVTDRRPENDESDDSFVTKATQLVDDVTLAASLGSRSWIRWFHYGLHTTQVIEDCTKHVVGSFPEDVIFNDLLIERAETKDFIERATDALKGFRDRRRDLFLAVANLLTAHEANLLEMKFVLQFTALEKLKDHYILDQPDRFDFQADSDVKRLKKSIRELISDEIPDKRTASMLRKKVREFERAPLWDVVSDMLDSRDVAWADVYPPETRQPRFLQVRNALVHSADSVDPDRLWPEIERLRVVVERLLLRTMDWEDTTGAASVGYAERLADIEV